MGRHSTAHHFLEGLVDLGVEYIFANLGTDHVSLIEEMARWDSEGLKYPEMILCPHEVVAVHMAGGYALATGRGQAVLVHVDAGTANAAMAIQNLFRYRLPVMLFAGRAPYTLHGELPGSRDTYVHFVQDPFDIASIVRPYVKWEYSLPSGIVVKEALARASAFAQSDPPGPVYMMLPRETLAEQWDVADMPAYPPARYGGVHTGGIEPARVDAIAQALMAAENPIALTAYLGRKPQAVAVLDRLARSCGIRVAEFNSIDLNISQASPCFAGFDPLPLLEQADLGLLLDSDVPFIPRYAGRIGAIKWIQIDIDPLKSDFPMWGFPTDMRIQGDCATVLQHITRTKPQSYVGLAGGGLGFSGGMALGWKLAQPDRRIVQVIGDGGFHFSSPDSVYAVAQQYQLPILTVVLDNGGWQAVKSAVQRVYPKGIAAETDQFQSRLTSGRQGERRDFSDVAKAFGAYGECVTEPDGLAAAIDRCLAALDDGKAAVLHIRVTRL